MLIVLSHRINLPSDEITSFLYSALQFTKHFEVVLQWVLKAHYARAEFGLTYTDVLLGKDVTSSTCLSHILGNQVNPIILIRS